jgi:glycosyltransferase involved in cell wall biosynthesis
MNSSPINRNPWVEAQWEAPVHSPLFPRLGILNDYVRIPYANGSSFASQFLYREFRRRGSEVTVVGPNDPKATEAELPPNHVSFAALPFRIHPGVQLSFPNRAALDRLAQAKLSLMIAQSGSALLDAGVWLRRSHCVPLVCVNTIHLPSVYDVLLPQAVHKSPTLNSLFQNRIIPWVEQNTVSVYNSSDGLVVLSEGLRDYWSERGVTVPISVIPRSVDPTVFDRGYHHDPFPQVCRAGRRLLVVCRHTREKNVERLLEIFARYVAPVEPKATLTLVGDGPDHDLFRALAERLGIADRCYFPGEISLTDMAPWYRHADLFVYTSLSETYGQVVSEALWCGLPVVALDDDKGVSDQVVADSDGFLIRPEAQGANGRFATRVLELLRNREMRAVFSQRAEAKARFRSDPARCIAAYEETFVAARERCLNSSDQPGFLKRTAPLAHMTLLHSLLAVLGCVRRPGTVNRHGRPQPLWDAFDGKDAQRSGEPRRLKSVPSAA